MLTENSNIKLRWMAVCAILMVIIALLVACQPPSILTSDDLVGIWTNDFETAFVEYREDGTYRTSDSPGGLETLVGLKGQYQLQGSRLTLQTAEDSVNCQGLEGSYQVKLNKDGELEYELEADECTVRRVGMTTGGPNRRVSP